MFWNKRKKTIEQELEAIVNLLPPPPQRTARGWCLDNKAVNCSDYGQKCRECSNYNINRRVSHFKPIEKM